MRPQRSIAAPDVSIYHPPEAGAQGSNPAGDTAGGTRIPGPRRTAKRQCLMICPFRGVNFIARLLHAARASNPFLPTGTGDATAALKRL